jgi:hypothetical protein
MGKPGRTIRFHPRTSEAQSSAIQILAEVVPQHFSHRHIVNALRENDAAKIFSVFMHFLFVCRANASYCLPFKYGSLLPHEQQKGLWLASP